ncbi:efflux RND transporter periplasmic adaptor subunit [Candidatus Sumerlaeota bacterium]|nr:efflux RND transporter periplasmic adaptor subunit [Candidatus Sumerlaeota bacterium]
MSSKGMGRLKKTLWIVGSIVGLVLILMWMAGTFRSKIQPEELPEPSERRLASGQATAEVHEVMEQVVETFIGTVAAERKTTVAPKILSTVRRILVSAGSSVKKDDLLVELDDRDLRSQLRQADDALQAARAQLTNAETYYKRMKEALEGQAVSQNQFDEAKTQFKVAQAEVSRAQQRVEEARVTLSYAKIAAPIDGRVVDRLAEPGDTVAPGRPILALYDPSALRLEAPVREGLATGLKVGDPLQVHIDAVNLDLDGRIDEIVPQSEAVSRSLLVKVGLPHQAGLYQGMFGRLLIPAGERRRVCMPEAAIERVGQLQYVDVVGTDGVLEKRFIQTGEHGENGNVELLSGARPGEKVVVRRSSPASDTTF